MVPFKKALFLVGDFRGIGVWGKGAKPIGFPMALKDPSYPLLWSQHTPASRMAFVWPAIFGQESWAMTKKHPGELLYKLWWGDVYTAIFGIITNHEIRILINKPVFHVESKADFFPGSSKSIGLNVFFGWWSYLTVKDGWIIMHDGSMSLFKFNSNLW